MLGSQGYPALVSLRAAGTVKRSPREPQGLTGGSNSLFKRKVRSGGHQSFPSSSGRLRGIPRSSEIYFLKFNDGLSLLEFTEEPIVGTAQLVVFLDQRVLPTGLAASFLGPEGLEGAGVPLPPPGGQVGGVEPLPAQQDANLPRLAPGVGFLQDTQFIGRGETPAPGSF
jgi:hypothetical protein